MYLLLTRFFLLFCFLILINCENKWKIVWSNEFDKKQLDLNQWIIDDEPEGLCTGISNLLLLIYIYIYIIYKQQITKIYLRNVS
jgi:hypothetical protein